VLLDSELRREYRRGRLEEATMDRNPLNVFAEWLELAVESQIWEPNAMTLATATPSGAPSARVVLLKGFDARGFTFFTNYESRKGRELDGNPEAAAVFWWGPLERQVRIEGKVAKLAPVESDAYYLSRPFGARIGAWTSPQSQVIAGRQVLDERWRHLEETYRQQDLARPPYWGGYRLAPRVIEFWQGGENRLHDRLRYTLQPTAAWIIERLAP
jgi:pyridoxamine 5'-phosphate oxidase